MNHPVLILYGSQTGNAQDCAERLAREATALHFAPHVSSMDALDPTCLPQQRLVVMVAATTGQGDPPDNMRRFWRFLLRKSLPPDSLAGCHVAVFGLGDSSYPNFNTAAKKLWRRLQQLGGQELMSLGLGDDQAQGGYEAALDVWSPAVWRAARAVAGPLPPGTPQPELSPTFLLELGQPKYKVTFLPSSQPTNTASTHEGDGSEPEWVEAVQAACAFRGLAAAASGALGALTPGTSPTTGPGAGSTAQPKPGSTGNTVLPMSSSTTGAVPPGQAFAGPYGAWRPYMARLAVNRRLTAASHFQDTRHLELDLEESGISYEPGDVLAVLPRTPRPALDALLARLGLDGDARVRVQLNPHGPAAAAAAAAAARAHIHEHGQTPAASHEPGAGHHQADQQRCGKSDGHDGRPSSSPPVVEARLRALVAGALDVAGASPRRLFFQVLQHFCPPGRERDRLAFFSTPEGRDELYTYNTREGRSVCEVLADFTSSAPPLEWLLEAAPHLKPRQFSIASSLRAHPRSVHLTVAVVQWVTPYKRRKQGLCSTYLASLQPSHTHTHTSNSNNMNISNGNYTNASSSGPHQQQDQGPRVAVWVERGALRLPASPQAPLLLVGPGTGVAPFRAFLQERAVQLAAAAAQADRTPATEDNTAAGSGEPAALPGPAPCSLFFGCRSRAADFYYAEEWEGRQAAGVLAPGPEGFVAAFSRDQPSKVYVTHKLREHGPAVWALLAAGCVVFVAGSANKMPAGVESALTDIAQEHGGLPREDAARFVRQLQTTGRYFVEAWS